MTAPSVATSLQVHTHALRALARTLVGEQDADDLVQDVAVEALRGTPAGLRQPLAWLATVLRFVAHKHRRARARRQRREQVFAVPEALPAADQESELADSLARLTGAVLALPQPYRETILLRYLQELSPTAIAARQAVPVATVKSRIQRGLALLRHDLAGARGPDWRSALAVAFALPEARPAAALAAHTTGVLLMATATKLTIGAAVAVAAAALAAFLLRDDRAGPQAEGLVAARPPAAAPVAAAADPDRPPADRGRSPMPAPAGTPEMAIRGRCVDEHGQPLAGCAVSLAGRLRESREQEFDPALAAWLAAHPEATWSDPHTTTAADGRFAFAHPWQPRWFLLQLQRDTLVHPVPVGTVTEGGTRDLGDLVVPRDCRVAGRVLDTGGEPAPMAWVQFWRTGVPPETPGPRVVEPAGSAAGFFTATLAAGAYRIEVPSRTLTSSSNLVVPAGLDHLELPLTVATVAAASTLRGTVVDEHQVPVAGVAIAAVVPSVSHGVGYAHSDERGAFTLHREPGVAAEAANLVFWKPGRATPRPATGIQWGREDVRLTLPAGIGLQVRVTRATDGVPVEDFALSLRPAADNPAAELADDSAEGSPDHHPQGLAVLDGLTVGRYALTVAPARADLAAAHQEVEVAPPGPVQIAVALAPCGSRLLRLRTDEARPVAGAAVELVDPRGGQVAWERLPPVAVAREAAEPVRLSRLIADARGEARLWGPTDHRLALRIMARGIAPTIVGGIDLGATEPLVVTLPRGARLSGTLEPRELVRELRRSYGLPEAGPPPAPATRTMSGFRLRRGTGPLEEFTPRMELPSVPVAGDGTFAIEDVPAGTWELTLETWSFEQPGLRGSPVRVAAVDLRAGATTEVRLDLGEWLPATIEGLVLENGAPLADREVTVLSRGPDTLGPVRSATARTDAAGRFQTRIRGGEVRVRTSHRLAEEQSWSDVWSTASVLAPAGQVTAATFQFLRGRVRVRVLDSDGNPVAGVQLHLVGKKIDNGSGVRARTARSDASGMVTCDVEAQWLSVQVFPRRLASPEAQRELPEWKRGGNDPLAPQRLEVGSVTPRPGATEEVEVRLPPEWYR